MAWNIHPHWNAPLSPKLWLEIATHGLAPQAAERVRAEHLAHLDDAVDAGESVEDVLREWGDPHRANDAFRKAHLTVTDRGLLHPGYALSAAGWRRAVFEEGEAGRAGMVILLPLLFTVLNATLHLPPAAGVAAALLIVLLVPTLRWVVIAGLRPSGAARVVAVWLFSAPGTIMALLLGVFWWRWDSGQPDGLGLGVVAALLLLWFWRLWAGLRALHKVESSNAVN